MVRPARAQKRVFPDVRLWAWAQATQKLHFYNLKVTLSSPPGLSVRACDLVSEWTHLLCCSWVMGCSLTHTHTHTNHCHCVCLSGPQSEESWGGACKCRYTQSYYTNNCHIVIGIRCTALGKMRQVGRDNSCSVVLLKQDRKCSTMSLWYTLTGRQAGGSSRTEI